MLCGKYTKHTDNKRIYLFFEKLSKETELLVQTTSNRAWYVA